MKKQSSFWKIGFFVLAVAVVILLIMVFNKSTDTSISKTGDAKSALTEVSKEFDENKFYDLNFNQLPQGGYNFNRDVCVEVNADGLCTCYQNQYGFMLNGVVIMFDLQNSCYRNNTGVGVCEHTFSTSNMCDIPDIR